VADRGTSATLTNRAISAKRDCKNGPGQVWFENILCRVKLPFGVPSYTNSGMPFLRQMSTQSSINELYASLLTLQFGVPLLFATPIVIA